jgi:ligand-binding sensor domain-containing protein
MLAMGTEVWLAHCCCPAGSVPEDACRLERVRDAGATFQAWPITNAWDFDQDSEGRIWIATRHDNDHLTYAHGLFRLSPSDSTWIPVNHHLADSLYSDQVRAVRVVGRVLWIGYDNAGVSRWDLGPDGEPLTGDDYWVHYTQVHGGLIGDNVRRIEVASDGTIWIGTTAGISLYYNGSFHNHGGGFGQLLSSEVTAILTTPDGGGWVATRDGGLNRMRMHLNGTSRVYDYDYYRPPLLPNPNIETMTFAPDGRTLWLGTERGLASFRPPAETTTASTETVVGAYPNPFNPACVTAQQNGGVRLLGTGGFVRGVVVDLSGRIIARFPKNRPQETQDPGEVVWDGRRDGVPVAPGLYYIRVQTPRGNRSVGVAILDGDCQP